MFSFVKLGCIMAQILGIFSLLPLVLISLFKGLVKSWLFLYVNQLNMNAMHYK